MDFFENLVVLSNKMEPKGFIEYEKGTNYHIIIVFQSDCLFSYDGHNFFPVSKNSVVIFDPNVLRSYKSPDNDFLNSCLFIKNEYFNIDNYPLTKNQVFQISENYAKRIVNEIDRLSFIVNTPFARHLIPAIPNYLQTICSLLIEAYHGSAEVDQVSRITTTFMLKRNKMFLDPINNTVKEMAASMSYNETYFGKKYKEIFGILPSQDRKLQLVEIIKNYLEKSDMSLDNIADLCKFKSVPYLINLFKSIEGITPHQYRLKYQKSILFKTPSSSTNS